MIHNETKSQIRKENLLKVLILLDLLDVLLVCLSQFPYLQKGQEIEAS